MLKDLVSCGDEGTPLSRSYRTTVSFPTLPLPLGPLPFLSTDRLPTPSLHPILKRLNVLDPELCRDERGFPGMTPKIDDH